MLLAINKNELLAWDLSHEKIFCSIYFFCFSAGIHDESLKSMSSPLNKILEKGNGLVLILTLNCLPLKIIGVFLNNFVVFSIAYID